MKPSILLLSLVALGACKHLPSQNRYNYDEVGQSVLMEYAVVVSAKEVNISGFNGGSGVIAGALAGGGAGSLAGGGTGAIVSTAGGAIAGAVAGNIAEQMIADQKGYQYTVVTETEKTKSIVQWQNPTDIIFKPGDRVLIETKGTYQRVQPTNNLPEQIQKPKGIKIVE